MTRSLRVCSPGGDLFCRECIYSNLLTQRERLDEQKKLYELQEKEKEVGIPRRLPSRLSVTLVCPCVCVCAGGREGARGTECGGGPGGVQSDRGRGGSPFWCRRRHLSGVRPQAAHSAGLCVSVCLLSLPSRCLR